MSDFQSVLHGSYYNFIVEKDFVLFSINLNYSVWLQEPSSFPLLIIKHGPIGHKCI